MAGNNTFKLPAFMTSTTKKKDEEEQSTGITNAVPSSNYMVPSFMRSQTTSVVPETPAPTRRERHVNAKRNRLGLNKEEDDTKVVPDIKIPEVKKDEYVSPYAKNADYAELSKYISTEKRTRIRLS